MVKVAAYLLIGVAVGLGLAWWQGAGSSGSALAPAGDAAGMAALERRLGELEDAIRLERAERRALAERLETLRPTLAVNAASEDDDSASVQSVDVVPQRFPDGLPDSPVALERTREQRQVERFVDAGFSPSRAAWLLQREEELEMEVLRERYEAQQQGASAEAVADMTVSRRMRAELGDADYEKYLAGQGRPTSISVRDVLTNSPARAAGLLPGDEILAYDGKRVFEMGELSELTAAARPGSTVVVDVERDGQRLQFYIEGGPLGISGGGRSTRRDFDGGR